MTEEQLQPSNSSAELELEPENWREHFDPGDLSTYPVPTKSVAPEIMCLDGHRFRINHGVPDRVMERFYELFNREEEVKYEDIPKDLLQYKVPSTDDDRDHLFIDGNCFRINYNVPADVTKILIELADREGIKLEDIPKELLKYEGIPGNMIRHEDTVKQD